MMLVLYGHRITTGLMCAIPSAGAVPSFIRTPVWGLAGTWTPDKPQPSGFNKDAARDACATQGFYTWQVRSA